MTPPSNVYDKIDNLTAPTLPADRTYDYNILLDWAARPSRNGKPLKSTAAVATE